MGSGFGLVQSAHNFREQQGGKAGEAIAGAALGLHPVKQENQWNPAGGVLIQLGPEGAEGTAEPEREVDLGDRHGHIGALLGWGGNKVLAAGERANGVNGASLVLEKRTGDLHGKVVEDDFQAGIGLYPPVFAGDSIENACLGQLGERAFEALSEFLLFGLRLGADPVGESPSLKEAYRDHHAAAGSAACLAGDGLAGLAQFGSDASENRVRQRMQDGQNLGEASIACRDVHDGGDLVVAGAEGELGRQRVRRLLSH